MSALQLRGVTKRFGETTALDNINLDVEKGSLVVLLGPTGAGKTTLQRIVAGLDTPDSGQVLINGKDVTGLQPNQRDVSVVFESLALYPNLTAFENIAHPLRIRGVESSQIKSEVHKLAEILHVTHILDRKPASFSGGEKQRIAIGRALIKPSAIYLLDEPLSSLDAVLRTGLRSELKRLLGELGHSFIFATPDYTEALALGDNVNVIMNGKIQQNGCAHDLYSLPASTDIATFVGNPPMNLLPAKITVKNNQQRIKIGQFSFELENKQNITPLDDVIVGIRPEDIKINNRKSNKGLMTFNAEILDQEPLGNRSTLVLRIGDLTVEASIDTEENLESLASINVQIDPSKFHFFSPDGLRLS